MKFIFYSFCFLFCSLQMHAQDFKFGHVSKEEVMEKEHPQNKDANAAVLFREHKVYYEVNAHTGFTLITEVHERIKIYSKDGFDWANKEISLYNSGSDKEKLSGLKGYTYNVKDGKLVDEKLSKNSIFEEEVTENIEKVKITMPAVTEGSVIEYRYSIRSPFLTSIDMVPLQYTIPINRLEAKVTIPEFLVFKRHVNPKSPLQLEIVESHDNFSKLITTGSKIEYLQNVYEVNASDIPGLKIENYVDYLQNYRAFIKWELQVTKFPNSMVKTYTSSWEDVVKNIYKSNGYSKELNRDFFKDDLTKATAGLTAPVDKIASIYGLLKQKVKWNGVSGFTAHNGGKSAWKEGTGNVGDINLLLTAMLNNAGIKAYPVLVSTKDNGIPVFPTRQGFNYVIAAAKLPNGNYMLLDATEEHAGPGELPWRARNWQGRIIQEDGNSTWINLMPTYFSVDHNTLNYRFDEKLVLKGKSIHALNGLYAKSYRDDYMSMTAEDYLKELEEDKGNIVISNVVKENEEKLGNELTETFDFELENGIEKISDKIYLKPMLFLARGENPFKADERNYPIFFDYPSLNKKTINIMLPKGYQVESLPESIAYDFNNGAGTYKFVVTQNGNFVRLDSEFIISNTVYTSQDYPALKTFFAQMVEKQSEAIVLSQI